MTVSTGTGLDTTRRVKIVVRNGILVLMMTGALIFAGCGKEPVKTEQTGSTAAGAQASSVSSFDTPSETFRLAIMAMEKGEFEKFRGYHVKELQSSIDQEYFDSQHKFFKDFSPEFSVTSESISGDQAFLDFELKIDFNGESRVETQKVELRRNQGLWLISSM